MRTPGGICLAATLLLASPAGADPMHPSPDLVQSIARKAIPEFVELLSLPNDSIRAADIEANARWLEAAFQKRGFTTRLLPNKDKPLVYAEFGTRISGAPTVLFYMHYDGMPVSPEQWAQKSPYQPVLRQRSKPAAPGGPTSFLPSTTKAATGWDDLDLAKSLSGSIDPEWRLFSRPASGDKKTVIMFLSALYLL